MSEFLLRVLFVLRFVAFMGVVYMTLHVLIAPLIHKPDSKIAAFFAVLTSPLMRPVRALAPPGTAESRLRLFTLAALVGLWLVIASATAVLSRSVV
jgi:hypothetical protein